MNSLIKVVGATVLSLLLSAHALAVPMLSFETSKTGSSVSGSFSGLGASPVLTLKNSLNGLNFSLAAGESYAFDFFDIYLPVSIGSGSVSAALGFISPEALTGSGAGSAKWASLGFISGGSLKWGSQPGLIALLDGSSFDLVFSDLVGIQLGNTATVRATVTARSVAVPEPSSLALLGLGLAALGMVRRNRA